MEQENQTLTGLRQMVEMRSPHYNLIQKVIEELRKRDCNYDQLESALAVIVAAIMHDMRDAARMNIALNEDGGFEKFFDKIIG